MKDEASVTLSKDLLASVDNLVGPRQSRTEFIEAAVRAYVALMTRREQNARDFEILNLRADELNKQAEDLLEYQVDL
ncbi:MAG: ribbon-helix-helix protein, CopG family [Pyrinomonadaceae bacterium]|nr:ribbon-helix-helix protein, CopG family [Pyrinomonadaceae bacterium]